MNSVRRNVGWLLTTLLVFISLSSIFSSGEVGSNSWIALLLIPFTVALALSKSENRSISIEETFEWPDDEEELSDGSEVSAGDFGYDTPIL